MELYPFDDYPFHQAVSPFAIPATSDSHFNDGYYFAWYRPGEHWFCGLRIHPNNNVMDGYAGVVADGMQRSVRVSRALRPDADTLQVGPLLVEILEPMRRQRVVLEANTSGVEFDVVIEATAPQHVEHGHTQYRHSRMLNHLIRYTQLGRASGVVCRDGGTRHEIERWHACRDHSWGIRSTMGPYVPIGGIEETKSDPRAIRIWAPFEVEGHSGFFHTHEDTDGVTLDFEGRLDFANGSVRTLTGVTHGFRYQDGTRRLAGGSFTLHDAEGKDHAYYFDVSADPAHPQGFGYARGWSDLGQPGVYRGASMEEADSFPTNVPGAHLGPEHVPEDRRLGGTEFSATITGPGGAAGMAHVEHMIYGTYRPAGFEGADR